MKNPKLWQQLKEFKLDDPNNAFTFSKRLARDNAWNLAYSQRVVKEYKKFIYLCSSGYGEITPSDQLDQAWHLHLTYTKSYWLDICETILQKPLHHNPTRGGTSQKLKFATCYQTTFEAYEKEFGEKPPKDIWPQGKERFSNIHFRRVNIGDYWVIKKPKYNKKLLLSFILPIFVLLFIQASGSEAHIIAVCIIVFIYFIAIVIRDQKKYKDRRRNKSGRRDRHSDSGNYDDRDWDSGCNADSGCSSGCGGCGGN